MNWKQRLIGAAAIVTAAGVLWTTLISIGMAPVLSKDFDVLKQQVASNSQTLALQRWQFLNTKRQNEGLSPSEMVEFCALSRQLGLKGQGCA